MDVAAAAAAATALLLSVLAISTAIDRPVTIRNFDVRYIDARIYCDKLYY